MSSSSQSSSSQTFQDIEAELHQFQLGGYIGCAMTVLVLYDYLLKLNREITAIWQNGSTTPMFKLLYAMLRYGGLVFALLPRFTTTKGMTSYASCYLNIVVCSISLETILMVLLDAMMTTRVYAMHAKVQSRASLAFLVAGFTTAHGICLGTALAAALPLDVQVTHTLSGEPSCSYATHGQPWLLPAGGWAVCGFEFILLIMALRAHFRQFTKNTIFDFRSLSRLVARDNLLYFIVAFCSAFLLAVQYPLSTHNSSASVIALQDLGEVGNALGYVRACMLGPWMMLAIQERNRVQVYGATVDWQAGGQDAAELTTLRYAAPMRTRMSKSDACSEDGLMYDEDEVIDMR